MNRWFGDAESWLQSRQQEMIELLGDLVSIESGSHDKEGVDRCGARFATELEATGFRLTYHRQARSGDHILGVQGSGGRGRVLLLGHLDTVWPKGTLAEWPFRVNQSRAYGPGVADMKGGLVVALFALRALKAVDAPLASRIAFLLVGDEELGSPTARGLVEAEALASDAALVVEPGRPNGEIVTARGGVGICELRATGRTAHAAHFQDSGVSAIEALAELIMALRALSRRDEEIAVNVGMIQGGSARQVVADRAWALVDLRAPTAKAVQELEGAVRRIVASPIQGANVEAAITWTRPPAPKTSGSSTLIGLARHVARELGVDLVDISSGGGSDGSFAAALGVPLLDGLGPVSGRTCSRDEYVELDTMVLRAALLAGVLGHIGEGALDGAGAN